MNVSAGITASVRLLGSGTGIRTGAPTGANPEPFQRKERHSDGVGWVVANHSTAAGDGIFAVRVSAGGQVLDPSTRLLVPPTYYTRFNLKLAYASGYGAGVRSPGWYQHLFVTPEQSVVPSWFVRVARALRDERLDASTASVVDAIRLAESLAAIRGRPSVGLSELTDATRAALTDGSDLPLTLIDRTLVVGQELGQVPGSTPMVPLAADLARQQRSLRLKPSSTATIVELDLRREAQLARSVLLHQLALLGIDWGELADTGRTTGTFKEAWQLEWYPELAVAVIEASLHGNTVASASKQVTT